MMIDIFLKNYYVTDFGLTVLVYSDYSLVFVLSEDFIRTTVSFLTNPKSVIIRDFSIGQAEVISYD